MNTTASLMLLAVALIAVLAAVGAVWAVKAPRAPAAGPRRRAGATKKAAPAEPAAIKAAPADDDEIDDAPAQDSRLQTHQQRIDAMRALLQRGDEKARRQATKGVPQFADTMPFEDDEEISPPTLPLARRIRDAEPQRKREATEPDSGHIPL